MTKKEFDHILNRIQDSKYVNGLDTGFSIVDEIIISSINDLDKNQKVKFVKELKLRCPNKITELIDYLDELGYDEEYPYNIIKYYCTKKSTKTRIATPEAFRRALEDIDIFKNDFPFRYNYIKQFL